MQAVYDWWQYRLCDVFIELVKPVMQRQDQHDGAMADKRAFRDTLWTCLDTGLRYRLHLVSTARLMIPRIPICIGVTADFS